MQVPAYQLQIGLNELPQARQDSNAGPADFLGATQAAFTDQAGAVAQRIDHGLAELYSQQLQEANAVRVEDARNQTQSTINTLLYGQDGALTQQGAVAIQGHDAVLQSLDQHIAEVSTGLANDEQRQQYQRWAADARQQAAGLLVQHQGQQFRVYQRGVGLATIAAQQQTMALNYNNPDLLDAGVSAIHQAAVNLARLEGYPEAYGAVEAGKQASAALQDAVHQAVQQGDAASADMILRQFSGRMQAEDLLSSRQQLQKLNDATTAGQVAAQVMVQLADRFDSTDFQRLRQVTLADPALSNTALTSYQADTAKRAGLPWQPELLQGDAAPTDAAKAYRQALAEADWRQQLQTFHGDAQQAWAAMHNGAGPVQQAVAQAARQGGDWLALLPQATQRYVQQNQQAYAAGDGQRKPATLLEAETLALQHLGDAAGPQLQRLVLNEIGRQFHSRKLAVQNQQDQNRAQAIQLLRQNGGDYAGLPVSVQAALSAKDSQRLQNFAAGVAADQPPQTDWRLYYRLQNDDKLLSNTLLAAYRDRLPDQAFKQLQNRQQHLQQGGDIPEQVPERDVLQRYMREAGLNPQPPASDREAVSAAGRIWAAYNSRLAAARQHSGKPLSQQDIEQVAGQLFDGVQVQGLLFGHRQKPAVLVDWRKDQVEVPEQDRAQIVAALQALRPAQPVTEDQVFYYYLQHKGLWREAD